MKPDETQRDPMKPDENSVKLSRLMRKSMKAKKENKHNPENHRKTR